MAPAKKSAKRSKLSWGRTGQATWGHVAGVVFILSTTPVMVVYFYMAISEYGGSIVEPFTNLISGKETVDDLMNRLPRFSWKATQVAGIWISFQVVLSLLPDILHYIIPGYKGGIQNGSVTPAGLVLPYNINGLQAWLISNGFFFINGIHLKLFSPTIIVDNFGGLLCFAISSGYVIAAFAYIKAHYWPTHPQDRKFTGSVLYDFVMGIELNPRFGRMFDFKLFLNGRPGIVAWTVINMSYAWKQHELHGHVTNSMLLVNFLHLLYVVDYFWNESWYLHTIDICHDHFGWYYGFGDMAWLPWMYTLQGHYLVYNAVDLSTMHATLVLLVGLSSYLMFRSVNRQKDFFRKHDGKCLIWGRKPTYVAAQYTTATGERRTSKLLTSGWWGIARHMNYTADLVGSFCYGASCGFNHLVPYFYFVFLTILLIHRCLRDEDRCKNKYGKAWDIYTAQVKYRLIPYVF